MSTWIDSELAQYGVCQALFENFEDNTDHKQGLGNIEGRIRNLGADGGLDKDGNLHSDHANIVPKLEKKYRLVIADVKVTMEELFVNDPETPPQAISDSLLEYNLLFADK